MHCDVSCSHSLQPPLLPSSSTCTSALTTPTWKPLHKHIAHTVTGSMNTAQLAAMLIGSVNRSDRGLYITEGSTRVTSSHRYHSRQQSSTRTLHCISTTPSTCPSLTTCVSLTTTTSPASSTAHLTPSHTTTSTVLLTPSLTTSIYSWKKKEKRKKRANSKHSSAAHLPPSHTTLLTNDSPPNTTTYTTSTTAYSIFTTTTSTAHLTPSLTTSIHPRKVSSLSQRLLQNASTR